jgi:cation/acetate symporter
LQQAQQFEVKLADLPQSLDKERAEAIENLRRLKSERADTAALFQAGRELANVPKNVAAARERWTRARQDRLDRAKPLAGMPPMAQAFAGDPEGSTAAQELFRNSRNNVLALMFCLMLGTVGLPHLLVRFYTTPSVAETRSSVAWSLFFIALLYVSAPALAVLVKYEVLTSLVGQRFDALPGWIAQWSRLDPALLSVQDVNADGLLQLAELRMGADIVMLATPELGGLPYVVSGLVAAGGLAAALSTADGLLLTIGNALARDLYFREWAPQASPGRLVILSKFVLLTVAMAAAYVAAQKPGEILFLVAGAFSLAGAAFVPAMVLGIFSGRTSSQGAVAGMLSGLGVTIYYMASQAPTLRFLWGGGPGQLWFGIQPISAGVFGIPCGLAVTWLVSRLSKIEKTVVN